MELIENNLLPAAMAEQLIAIHGMETFEGSNLPQAAALQPGPTDGTERNYVAEQNGTPTTSEGDACNPFLSVPPADEPLRPGDIIFYWHELYVCGNPMGERNATIQDVDPDKYPILTDTMDPLSNTHRVKRVKIMEPYGSLIDNGKPIWREIGEFKLEKSVEVAYQTSRRSKNWQAVQMIKWSVH